MKTLNYILLLMSIASLALSCITKFSSAKIIAGTGPTGFLIGAMVLLLFGANFALLELLNKR